MKIQYQSRTIQEGRWLVNSLDSLEPEQRMQDRDDRYEDSFYLAELYHQQSKNYPDMPIGVRKKYKYTDQYREINNEFIQIPNLELLPELTVPLSEVLRQRRTRRDGNRPISFEEFGLLLQYSAGVTETVYLSGKPESQIKKRAYPSGGMMNPIYIMAYIHNVQGLEKGLYRFCAYDNRLYVIDTDIHLYAKLTSTISGMNVSSGRMEMEASVPAVIIYLVANFTYQKDKYGARAYRLATLEAGHCAQNVQLVATALKLNTVPMLSFFDDNVHELLQVDGVEKVCLYMISIHKM